LAKHVEVVLARLLIFSFVQMDQGSLMLLISLVLFCRHKPRLGSICRVSSAAVPHCSKSAIC
jgi:hypothetical protein